MTAATPADVSARLGRALLAGETAQVSAYLEDAESKILGKLPNALSTAAGDPVYAAILKAVEVSIVLRAARLTDSVQSVYPSTETLSAPSGSSRANVTVLNTEWRALGLRWYTTFSMTPERADLTAEELDEQAWCFNGGWSY